jgi:hypothetical protein
VSATRDKASPRVAMAVDSAFVTLGETKPTLHIQVVDDPGKRVPADEQTGLKTRHHPGHLPEDRGLGVLEAIQQHLELPTPFGERPPVRF